MALAPRSTAPLLSSCQGPKPQGLPPEAMGSWKPGCLQEPPSTHQQLRVGDGVRVTLCPDAAGCLEQSAGRSSQLDRACLQPRPTVLQWGSLLHWRVGLETSGGHKGPQTKPAVFNGALPRQHQGNARPSLTLLARNPSKRGWGEGRSPEPSCLLKGPVTD